MVNETNEILDSFRKKKIKFNNKITKFIVNVVKFFIAIIFTPLFCVFSLVRTKLFLKVFTQVIVILYFICFLLLIYTFINRNKPIGNNEKVSVKIEFKDKIRDF